MSEQVPVSVRMEAKEIRRFIDETGESIGRDVLRRTIHRMLDRVCEAADNQYAEFQKHLEKQAEIMAETARRNVRLEAALQPVTEFDENVHDKMLNALRSVREAQRVMREGREK